MPFPIRTKHTSADQLLLQLRTVIDGTNQELPPIEISSELYQIANRQGVAAFLWDSFSETTRAGIDRNLRIRWAYNVQQTEATQQRQLQAAHNLTSLFEQAGIRTVIFKGLPLGGCYPVPEHRPCGDIDCWLEGKFAEGNQIISDRGISINYENPKHAIFRFEGIDIENHSTFLDTTQYRIDRIINDFMERQIAIEGISKDSMTGLWTLPPTIHALFLLRHSARHLKSGIALRHLCDWVFFIRRNSRQIDWGKLLPLLEQTRMSTFFSIMNGIAVDELGMDASLVPAFKREEELQQRILADILVFGTDKIETKNPAGIIFAKTRRIFQQRWKVRKVLHGNFTYILWRSVLVHLRKPKIILHIPKR